MPRSGIGSVELLHRLSELFFFTGMCMLTGVNPLSALCKSMKSCCFRRPMSATGSDRGFGEPQMNANERRYDQSLSASTSAKVGVPLQQTCPENHQ